MKREHLRVGATYRNAKGSARRILAFGPEFTLYASQAEKDCLSYAIVRGKRASHDHGRTSAGEQILFSTAASFAAWAQSVEEGDNV